MKKHGVILFILLLSHSFVEGKLTASNLSNIALLSEIQDKENNLTLDIDINGTTRVKLENVPQSGYLEVFSILGVRVTRVNLKSCTGSCYIDLPKGLYILKAGKTAQKIIVR